MDENEVEATIDLVHQAAMSGVDSVFKSEDWRCHPMFLNELPEDIENDKYLGAFQHVTYDGETPDSLAKNFKDIGNDLFSQGKSGWLGAANWWSRALEEKMTDKKLRSILHSNRATVSLGLGQFQRAVLDANWAIENDKYNKKAYVRAAHAYQGMGNWDKALSAAKAGLEIMEEDEPLAKLLHSVVEDVNSHLENGDKKAHDYLSSLAACSTFFRKVKYSVGDFQHSWQKNWDLVLQFDEEKNETIWPLAVVFDEVLQCDFIEGFSETVPLIEMVSMILPGLNKEATAPLWDTNERYTTNSVCIYITTHIIEPRYGRDTKKGQACNILVDSNACLRDIFIQKDYVIPGFPLIYIAVKKSGFIQSLEIKEIISPGGMRNKIDDEIYSLFISSADGSETSKDKDEEAQPFLPLHK